MSYHNYTEIAHKLRVKEPFEGNTMSGSWGIYTYTVLSYDTVIATYDSQMDKVWINPKRFSVTTSRHQNLVKANFTST